MSDGPEPLTLPTGTGPPPARDRPTVSDRPANFGTKDQLVTFLGSYNKTIVAVIGAALVWGVKVLTSKDPSITSEEWANLLQGVGIAAGVWAISNDRRNSGVSPTDVNVVVTDPPVEPV